MAVRFEIGNEVRVKSNHPSYSSYKGKYYNCTGTVDRISGSRIGVFLHGYTNDLSRYGVFWFDQSELAYVNNKENNKEEYIMDKNYDAVKVKYLDSSISKRELVFAAYEPYEVNDYVVVNSGHHGFVVGQITSVENVEGNVQYGREIICKIDMTAYNDRKEHAKRRAELKDMMDSAVKDFKDMTMYEMIAAKNPEFAKLLEEFKELG